MQIKQTKQAPHIFRLHVLLALAFILSAQFGFSKSLENVDRAGLGIKGYDPVAYFTDNAPVLGSSQFQSTFDGVIYHFNSAAHKEAFDAKPEKYAPQFGGFCAYGVSKGSTVSIDPAAFQIVDGRLLLQYSTGIRETFNKDSAGNLKKADANWILLLDKKGK